jgi:hypothetical protein
MIRFLKNRQITSGFHVNYGLHWRDPPPPNSCIRSITLGVHSQRNRNSFGYFVDESCIPIDEPLWQINRRQQWKYLHKNEQKHKQACYEWDVKYMEKAKVEVKLSLQQAVEAHRVVKRRGSQIF